MTLLDDVYDELVYRRRRRQQLKITLVISLIIAILVACAVVRLPYTAIGCLDVPSSMHNTKTEKFCFVTLKER